MTRRLPLLLLPLLFACKGGSTEETGETGGVTETGDTQDTQDTQDTGEEVLVEVDPEVAYFATRLPMELTIATSFLTNGEADGCPSVRTMEGGVTLLTGGCTDDDGATWTGTATLTLTGEASGSLIYVGFGQGDFTADGQIDVDGNAGLSASMELVLNQDATPTTITYTNYGVSDWGGYGSALFGAAGGTGFVGTLRYGGEDGLDFTASGTMSNTDDGCSGEFDSGTLSLSSSQGDLDFSWSKDECDGCAAWTWQGESGLACEG